MKCRSFGTYFGPGKVCITKLKTGFGAAMVMVGSLFAGHEESPAQTVDRMNTRLGSRG